MTKLAKAINIRSAFDFEEIKGSTFVNLVYETPVKLLGGKKNEQQDRVTCRTTTQAMIFTNQNKNAYEAMVNRRLESEGKPADFIVSAPAWKDEKVIPGVVKYTPKGGNETFYIEFIKIGKSTTKYFLDGQAIEKSEIQGLAVPKPQPNLSVENRVDFRKVKIDNIKEISAQRRKIRGPFTFE